MYLKITVPGVVGRKEPVKEVTEQRDSGHQYLITFLFPRSPVCSYTLEVKLWAKGAGVVGGGWVVEEKTVGTSGRNVKHTERQRT